MELTTELTTTLAGQTVQNQIREVGINPNYWYCVAWAKDLKPEKILPVMIWQQTIALYRDVQSQVYAVENACPHKGVAMDKGKVETDRIVCGYHGWAFNPDGDCVEIPYWNSGQKLPCAKLRTYPIQERYGLIWIFPGDTSLAETVPLPEIPEFDQSDWLMVPIGAAFQAHFSICNENTMDVFHGYLHQNLQGWFEPVLLKLKESETAVRADYQVSYQGALTKFLGLSESGGLTTKVITIEYQYPHYRSQLEGVSSLYLMRLPICPTQSRSFALFFLKIRVPKWLLTPLKPILQPAILHLLFMRFLRQDIEMINSEQANYLKNSQRRYVEVNPAIIAIQRLIVRQYRCFIDGQSPDQPLASPVEHQTTPEAARSGG